jgi:PhnB protein
MPAKPAQYHTVTPTLLVGGAAQLIEFAAAVFGAEEIERFPGPDGLVLHAEIRLGDSVVMVADPVGTEPLPGALYIYVDDVDAAYERALAAGAAPLAPPEDQFYGARVARLRDPFGNLWAVATHIEDVPPEEARRRFDALMQQH